MNRADAVRGVQTLPGGHMPHMNSKHGRSFPIASTNRRSAALALASAVLFAASGCASSENVEGSANDADALLSHGQYQQAADTMESVVADHPGDWRAQFAYGRAELGLGKLEEARRALDRAYRLQPANEDIVVSLAECMAKQKDVKDAYQLLRAFGKDFRSWRAYLSLSHVAEDSGDPDTAVASAMDSIKVNEPLPGQRPSIEPYMRAADLSFRFGKEADGIRRLRQAYGIAPNDPRIVEALDAHKVTRGKETALPLGP
jgi:tetratricopeptide (TPR) repeat protein